MTDQAIRALVVAAGESPGPGVLATLAASAAIVIAADGGLDHCLDASRRPDLVVGDGDSARPGSLGEAEALGATVIRHPVAKDETDLELALEAAVDAGARVADVVGVFGGRLDHELANISLLAADRWHQAGLSIRATDGDQSIWPVRGRRELSLDVGSTVSLLAWAGPARVTTEGLHWKLDDSVLASGSPRGVSNVVTAPTQLVDVSDGVVLVVAVGVPQD